MAAAEATAQTNRHEVLCLRSLTVEALNYKKGNKNKPASSGGPLFFVRWKLVYRLQVPEQSS